MVNFKLKKEGDAIFYSHHDMMRILLLAIRRADIPVKVNKKGRAKIYFSPATSVGVYSFCEFIQIDTDLAAHKVANMLETFLPKGVLIFKEYNTKQRVNIAQLAKLAKYEIEIDGVENLQKGLAELLKSANFKVYRKINGENIEDLPSKYIHNFYFDKGKLFVLAHIGDENINIVQTIAQALNKLGAKDNLYKITKTNIFANFDNRFHDIDLMLIRAGN